MNNVKISKIFFLGLGLGLGSPDPLGYAHIHDFANGINTLLYILQTFKRCLKAIPLSADVFRCFQDLLVRLIKLPAAAN